LALPESLNGEITSYKVEGIGYDFVPNVLDRSLVDHWIKTSDKESFVMARRLIKSEGLFVGGSSGSAMVAAVKYAKTMKKGERLVVLLPDSVRNYMSKFLSDSWMVENNFMEDKDQGPSGEWWTSHTVASLKLNSPVTVSPDVNVADCIALLKREGYDQLPVVDSSGAIQGMATMGNLTAQITKGRISVNDPVSKVLFRQFKKIPLNTTLGKLSSIFNHDHFALVTQTNRNFAGGAGAVSEKSVVFGVVTRVDLLDYIMKSENRQPTARL